MAEISKKTGIPLLTLNNIISLSLDALSLDTPIGEEQEDSLEDIIPDNACGDFEQKFIEQDNKKLLNGILDTLSKREKDIIMYKFGLNGQKILTLDAIGEKMKLSKERVRQIEISAMRKLRQPNRAKCLQELTFV